MNPSVSDKHRILVYGFPHPVRDLLVRSLQTHQGIERCRGVGSGGELESLPSSDDWDVLVYETSKPDGSGDEGSLRTPDLDAAGRIFEWVARGGTGAPGRARHLILIASGAIQTPSHRHAGLLSEARWTPGHAHNAIASSWFELEKLARESLAHSRIVLTVLRPMPVLVPGGRDGWSRLLKGRLALTLPGHDPSLQFLSPEDLVAAVGCAVTASQGGTYNVVPKGVVPLRQALRLAGTRRCPVPRWLQTLARKALAPLGLAAPSGQLDYIRYPWTLSGEKIRRELGFRPGKSSAEAIVEMVSSSGFPTKANSSSSSSSSSSSLCNFDSPPAFDDFGLDKDYVARLGRTLHRFLHDRYWRVEHRGLEHVPRKGRAVLTGIHRGFMPWDGVMTFYLIVRHLGRYPRFLIHPTLVKFPFLAPYLTRIGGVIACRENADRVLAGDELLGIYPEGIRGAFTLYRDAYRLGRFGRDEYVKAALRNRAPIVPFVTLGSAEVFPILAKIQWRWWKRVSEWPCLPITPTLGLVPLPSKWHTWFLEPLHVEEQYPPEAAGDPAVVRALSQEVRTRMEAALAEMLRRRKSIFHGSIFEPEAAPSLKEKPA